MCKFQPWKISETDKFVVDFDDAEYNGFSRILGKENTEKLLRGCSVHWMRSVNKVSKLVCDTKEEELVFKALARNVEEAIRKEDVMEIFDILSGKKDLKNATPHVPKNLKHLCETSEASNNGWKKLKHWANWWARPRHFNTNVYKSVHQQRCGRLGGNLQHDESRGIHKQAVI